MSCTQPLKGFRSTEKSERTGLPLITFNPLKAINSQNPIEFPCGTCTGCRLSKLEDWATRCTHEAQMHASNCFITLTYANEHLPEDYSVNKRTWQLFFKRLRKQLPQVRFFACGEYGDENLRPHYHALIFGWNFVKDRTFHSTSETGGRQYESPTLSNAWPYGRALLSDFEPSLAGYCSGYVMKKIGGDPAADHYTRVHPLTLRFVKVEPEFALQSRNPGIGSTWFDRFKSDIYPSDFVVVDGRQKPIPQYYLRKLAEEELLTLEKQRRHKHFRAGPARWTEKRFNDTPERRAVREAVLKARLAQNKRTLKDDNQ